MINSSLPANVLDLKKSNALANAKDVANKKVTKGKGFGDELVEKQKKLKKKDEDIGPVQQSKSDRQDKSISKDSKQESAGNNKVNASATDTASADKAKTATVATPNPQTQLDGQPVVVDPMAAQATADSLDMLQISEGEMPLSDTNSADFAKNLNGKLSLEGFQMVEPQEVVTETTAASPEESAAMEALKSLAATAEGVTAKGDSHSKDLSSKKDGSDAQMDLTDMLATAPVGIKENQQTSFANALKEQSADALTMNTVRQSNVDNMVTSARTLLRDGGGEMQVVLTPDGLGTVDLKIGVDKGVVSVEINTQDKNVKKLFDDSIMDIRHALEGQNLKIDTVKVAVSENFDAQQQMSQGQMDMMEREFARDFMGQFRDERQGFRTANLTDRLSSPNIQPNKPEGLNPASRPGVANGRLNVVA